MWYVKQTCGMLKQTCGMLKQTYGEISHLGSNSMHREYHRLPWGHPRQPTPVPIKTRTHTYRCGLWWQWVTGLSLKLFIMQMWQIVTALPCFSCHITTMVLNNPTTHTNYPISYSQPSPPQFEKRGKKNMVHSCTVCFFLSYFTGKRPVSALLHSHDSHWIHTTTARKRGVKKTWCDYSTIRFFVIF